MFNKVSLYFSEDTNKLKKLGIIALLIQLSPSVLVSYTYIIYISLYSLNYAGLLILVLIYYLSIHFPLQSIFDDKKDSVNKYIYINMLLITLSILMSLIIPINMYYDVSFILLLPISYLVIYLIVKLKNKTTITNLRIHSHMISGLIILYLLITYVFGIDIDLLKYF